MMSLSDFGLELPPRNLILILLIIEDENMQKEIDILHMNKILKLYEHNIAKKEIEFTNFYLGAVSYEIQETIDLLEDIDLIEKDLKDRYRLTKKGEKAAIELKNNTSELEMNNLKLAKKTLNNLDFNELLFYMYMKFPKTQINSTQMNKLRIMKKGLINKLILKNIITEETANRWLISE